MSISPSPRQLPPLLHKLPFFYGWVVLGVVMGSGFLAAGVNNVAMGVIFKPLSQDMGWSRSLTAGAIAAGTIGAGLLAPFLGRLADRVGPRVLLPLGAAAVGGLGIALSAVTQPWQFYAAYVPARALGQTLLFGVVPVTAVANWFHLKRPRAMGLLAMAIPMGAATMALFYQLLIAEFGWRSTFVALAVLLWTAVLVPGAVLLRRQPEDVGLLPDGRAPSAHQPGPAGQRRPARPAALEHHWTFTAASRTPALWLLAISAALYTAASGGTAFHLAAYLTDMGIDPIVAAGALSLFSFSGGVASGLWGFLAERASPKLLNVTSMFLNALGVLLLLQVRSVPAAYGLALVFGATSRGQEALLQILLAHYFGRHSFGAISGVMESALRIGLGLGPLLAAAAYDLTGTYQGVFLGFVASFSTSMLLIGISRKPVPDHAQP
jgi:MFS family permease